MSPPITLAEHRRIHADIKAVGACRAVLTAPMRWHPVTAFERDSQGQVVLGAIIQWQRWPNYTDGIALNKTGAHC